MAEVLAALSLTAESISICLKLISLFRKFYAAVKDTRDDLNGLVKLIGKTRNTLEFMRVSLVELRGSEDPRLMSAFIIAEDGMREALRKLLAVFSSVAEGESRLGVATRLKWSIKKTVVQELSQHLEAEERGAMNAFIMITTCVLIDPPPPKTVFTNDASFTSLKTNQEITRLRQLSDEQAEIAINFADTSIKQHKTDVVHIVSNREPKRQHTWLGHVYKEGHSEDYIQAREDLSEAAFNGQWDTVFKILDKGVQLYEESWINAPRLKAKSQHDSLTMWTPLHQAVYHYCSVDIVQKLLNAGAFKSLRTRKSRYVHPNISALELAYAFEATNLYDMLCPVIRRPVPSDILQKLQDNFHKLIHAEVGRRVVDEKLYLPLLEVLMELNGDTIWFPVKFQYEAAGYLFQLHGRGLQVKSANIQKPDEEIFYEITEAGIYETDQVFTFAGDLDK